MRSSANIDLNKALSIRLVDILCNQFFPFQNTCQRVSQARKAKMYVKEKNRRLERDTCVVPQIEPKSRTEHQIGRHLLQSVLSFPEHLPKGQPNSESKDISKGKEPEAGERHLRSSANRDLNPALSIRLVDILCNQFFPFQNTCRRVSQARKAKT